MKQVFFFPGKDINEDTGKCEAAEDTNEDLDVGEATVVDDDVPSEEIAVADDEAEADEGVAGDVAVAAVSVHDLDKDELKWDNHEGWLSDVVILHVLRDLDLLTWDDEQWRSSSFSRESVTSLCVDTGVLLAQVGIVAKVEIMILNFEI